MVPLPFNIQVLYGVLVIFNYNAGHWAKLLTAATDHAPLGSGKLFAKGLNC